MKLLAEKGTEMPFKHPNGGYTTSSPIYDYSTGNGGPKAPRGKHGSESSIQHKLQPDFEAPKYMNDKLEPRDCDSGQGYPRSNGPSALPDYNASNRGDALDRGVERGIPNRNSFTQKNGVIGSGRGGSAKGDRGVAYTDSRGNRQMRGKSG
jgi:hypothetical protein